MTIITLIILSVNSYSELEVTANPEKLIVIEGTEVILKCTIAHGRLYRWKENSFPFFISETSRDIKKMF